MLFSIEMYVIASLPALLSEHTHPPNAQRKPTVPLFAHVVFFNQVVVCKCFLIVTEVRPPLLEEIEFFLFERCCLLK